MLFSVIFIPLLNSLFLGYHINVNPILLSSLIKVFLSYNLILLNILCSFLFIISFSGCVDYYLIEVVNLCGSSLSIVLSVIVIYISSIVLLLLTILDSITFMLILSCFNSVWYSSFVLLIYFWSLFLRVVGFMFILLNKLLIFETE
jgi:hypothetical protein